METKTHSEIQDFLTELKELGKGIFTFTLDFWNGETIKTQTIKIPLIKDVFKAYAIANAMLIKEGATDITPLEYATVEFNDGAKDVLLKTEKIEKIKLSNKELEEIEIN